MFVEWKNKAGIWKCFHIGRNWCPERSSLQNHTKSKWHTWDKNLAPTLSVPCSFWHVTPAQRQLFPPLLGCWSHRHCKILSCKKPSAHLRGPASATVALRMIVKEVLLFQVPCAGTVRWGEVSKSAYFQHSGKNCGDSLLAVETRRCMWLPIQQIFHGKSIISNAF